MSDNVIIDDWAKSIRNFNVPTTHEYVFRYLARLSLSRKVDYERPLSAELACERLLKNTCNPCDIYIGLDTLHYTLQSDCLLVHLIHRNDR